MEKKTAADGKWLYNGYVFAKEIYTPDIANMDEWEEVDDDFKTLKESFTDGDALNEIIALKNTIKSDRDGVGKIIADSSKPFPLYLPMYVEANQFYQLTENDGIKDIVSKYVAVADGMVSADNLGDLLTEWYD